MAARTASWKTSELLDSVLRAHGGVDRWNRFEEISAVFVTGPNAHEGDKP
jgi:hypothetical protein